MGSDSQNYVKNVVVVAFLCHQSSIFLTCELVVSVQAHTIALVLELPNSIMALQACRKLMNAVEAIKIDREDSDNENDDDEEEAFTMADEDKIMTHMMDCVALLAAMQKEEQQDIPANRVDSRMSRNKVFMAALSAVGGSLLGIDKNEQPLQANAAIDHLL